ncbi:MAG: hypothetical protein IIV00_04120 [Peptococcaceae bacterium]|nr:hypothetical protein [Peptococcaceae bacterium]
MSTAQKINRLVTLLPESDQNMIYELVKKFILAWDPDYTKLTPQEYAELEIARNDKYISGDDIDWDHLENYI